MYFIHAMKHVAPTGVVTVGQGPVYFQTRAECSMLGSIKNNFEKKKRDLSCFPCEINHSVHALGLLPLSASKKAKVRRLPKELKDNSGDGDCILAGNPIGSCPNQERSLSKIMLISFTLQTRVERQALHPSLFQFLFLSFYIVSRPPTNPNPST